MILDVASGGHITKLSGHTAWVTDAELSCNGNKAVTSSMDHSVRTWDSATGEPLSVLTGHTEAAFAATFSPNGDYVVSTDGHGTIKVFAIADQFLVQTACRIRQPHNGATDLDTYCSRHQ